MVQYYEIIDGGENNVYHFLFYMISNFLISNDINDTLVYYYPNKNNCKISEGFLALLPPNFIRHLIKDPTIDYISFMNAIPIYDDVCIPESYFLIRDIFKDHYSKTLIKGKYVYIRREGLSRKLYNEADVTACMILLGFDAINLENYDIKDQIKIISEAEIIVSPHGAGLSYTVFCNKDATVIEIYGDSLKKRHFLHIAHVLGHKFLRFDDVIFHDGMNENMTVNIEKLNTYIQNVIH